MKRALIALLVPVLLAFGSTAFAGPIIIAGTDADDHGSSNGIVNFTGWLFMQKAFENLAPAVGNGQKTAACIGCNAGQAANAFNSAFSLSNLPGAGWNNVILTSAADITNFFNGTGVVNVNNTGILYMPTGENNVGGGISGAQLAIVNANAAILNTFVANGGGLFTQDENPSFTTGGYGWLTTLLPGLNVHGDNDSSTADSGSLTLTAAGSAAFPGLTNGDLSNATPWHDWFDGNFGGLSVLVTGPAFIPPGQFQTQGPGAVVLGGGAGTVIQCGQPGQPPCGTPEPTTLFLLGSGLIGLAALRRWR